VTTFWLTFSSDVWLHIKGTFRGVVILDLDEGDRELSNHEVFDAADEMGLCPGAEQQRDGVPAIYFRVQDATEDNIPAHYKNRLITDYETLVALGADMLEGELGGWVRFAS
jgi:hypothetical protein